MCIDILVCTVRLRHLNRTLMDFFSHRTPHSPWPTDEKSFFTFFFISKNESALALWSLASIGVWCILYNNAPCFLTTPRLDRYYPQYAVSAWNIILINTTSILNHILKTNQPARPGCPGHRTTGEARAAGQTEFKLTLSTRHPVILLSQFTWRSRKEPGLMVKVV